MTGTAFPRSLDSETDSPVAPTSVRDIMVDLHRRTEELAIAAVRERLAIFADKDSDPIEYSKRPDRSLFDTVVAKIAQSLGDDPAEDIKAIVSLPPTVARRALWRWEALPYAALCAAKTAVENENDGDMNTHPRHDLDAISSDVDEWYVSRHDCLARIL